MSFSVLRSACVVLSFDVRRSTCVVLSFDVRRSTFVVLSFDVRRSAFVVRHNSCSLEGVGARRFQELEAWRLSDELKREVYALLETKVASSDFRFCAQMRESAASAPRNIAEGFGRFRPAPFAQFVEIAIGSIMETQDALKDGVDRRYFTEDGIARARSLAERSLQVSVKLLRYLKSRRHT